MRRGVCSEMAVSRARRLKSRLLRTERTPARPAKRGHFRPHQVGREAAAGPTSKMAESRPRPAPEVAALEQKGRLRAISRIIHVVLDTATLCWLTWHLARRTFLKLSLAFQCRGESRLAFVNNAPYTTSQGSGLFEPGSIALHFVWLAAANLLAQRKNSSYRSPPFKRQAAGDLE